MATYTYTTLDDPLGNTYTAATGINATGQIVGWYLVQPGQQHHGFLYSNGDYATLDDPLAGSYYTLSGTVANGMNAAGQVVGDYGTTTGTIHGFLYSGNAYTTLDDPLATNTYPYDVNATGQIAGSYQDTIVGFYHGFLYSAGIYSTLEDPLAAKGTWGTGINDQGHVVGYYDTGDLSHGFVYINGTYTTIDDPLGTYGTWATGINNLDQIVGYYLDDHGDHGFVYSGGSFTSIEALSIPSGTQAFGINDSGDIVGQYFDRTGAHGFLATPSIHQPNVVLTDSNLVVEMAELANEAYDKSTALAKGRNWHAVSAADLHLQTSGANGNVKYTLVDGVYDVAIPVGHADALVLEGNIDGVETLTVAFKGTDDWGARINWPTPVQYFSYFLPLISALSDYIRSHSIQHLLFTGHSLGGSMVQDALSFAYTGITTAQIDGYTWASPGADRKPIDPSHLVNFEHTNDPSLGFGPFILGPRYGTDILIDSATESSSPFGHNFNSAVLLPSNNPAHSMDGYLLDTGVLVKHANEKTGAFYTSPDAAALRSGEFWRPDVSKIEVIPGANHDNNVTVSSQDYFVLGGPGNDSFHWAMQRSATPDHVTVVDGGQGTDTLYLPGPQSLWSWSTTGTETDLSLKGSHGPVAILHGIEYLHFDLQNTDFHLLT
ncbi:hypothetical protein [Bradyrhizobium elkanii]